MATKTKKPAEAADYEHYPIHDLASCNPKMSDTDRADLKDSIRLVGLLKPLTGWKDDKGKAWTIDGRHRDMIVTEIRAEGITQAANGKEIKHWYEWFDGDRKAAFDFVVASNIRRDMTASQKAAWGVRLAGIEKKYRGKSSGDYAELLAAKIGANRQYVYQCQKIEKFSPELLDQVIQGTLKVLDAIKQVKDAEGTAATPTPRQPGVIYDGEKQVVPEHLIDIFKGRANYKAVIRSLKKLVTDVDEIADGMSGCTLPKKETIADIKNVIRTMQERMPHVPCVWCSGTGVDPDDSAQVCGHCNANLYIDKVQYGLAPDNLKVKHGDGNGDGGKGDDDDGEE